MRLIVHITDRPAWERAREDGVYRAVSLDTEGFIHCSTVDQLVETANRFFRGQDGLVVLCIDEDRVAAPVRYEAPATPDPTLPPDTVFPHVYGPIPVAAVVGAVDLPPEPDGTFALPRALTRVQGARTRPY